MLRMILWLEICVMIGHDTNPYQVYEVQMKHEWVKRKHTRWRLWNSNEIIVLPKDYLSLSNVGLNRHFLRTIGIRQNKTIFDHETQLVMATAVHWLGYQVLRKPPDKYYNVYGTIVMIEMTSYKRMFFRFMKWLLILFAFLLLGQQTWEAQEFSEKEASSVLDAEAIAHEMIRCQLAIDTFEETEMQACMANAKVNKERPRPMGTWGADSTPIVIDSATTRTLTLCMED